MSALSVEGGAEPLQTSSRNWELFYVEPGHQQSPSWLPHKQSSRSGEIFLA